MAARRAPWRQLLLACLAGLGALPALAQNLYRLDLPFVDDRGRSVRLGDWRGREAVVTMEYSACRFMCSITAYKLKQAHAAADRRGKAIDFIVISLDPRHDTPAAWAAYRKERELPEGNWHFLTGPEKATPMLAALLGIAYWYEGEHLLHDFRLLHTAADGQVVRAIGSYDADVNVLLD